MYGPTLHVCTFLWKPIVWNPKLLKSNFHRNTSVSRILLLNVFCPLTVPRGASSCSTSKHALLFSSRQMTFFLYRSTHALWSISVPTTFTKSLLSTPAPCDLCFFSCSLVLVAWLFIWYLSHLPSIQCCADKYLITASLGEGESPDCSSAWQFL